MRIAEAEGDRVVAALASPAESAHWLWFAMADGAYGRLPLAEFPKYRRGREGSVRDAHARRAALNYALLFSARRAISCWSSATPVGGRIIRLDKAEIRKRGEIPPERLLPLRDQEQVERALRLLS